MSYFNKRKSTGVFLPSVKGFSEYKGEIGDGSISGITNILGYHGDQLYSIFPSDKVKPKIWAIEVEVFTRNIAFVVADTSVTYLTQKDINKHMKDFSVAKEFNALNINDILSTALENSSFTTEFLSKVLNLSGVSRNGMFYSEKIKTYLYFTNGILTNFQVDDGLMPYARYLQEVNSIIYGRISELAYKYWPKDDFKAKREINIHCEAWSRIPDAFRNKFTDLHRTENGGTNLHMLLVCHYGQDINFLQFQEINIGRFQIEQNDATEDIVAIKMGNFRYYFDKVTERLLSFDQLI
ncbi:hypothetical protein SF1_38710 [Sphingobacterium faecium NBRC 15299]|uniref:hypothetical protein n=1 Tax=Sphingobacterium faecium TaxID=34087 RepID=UPI000D3C4890|nr:hypothetical protein [Sphingobacterium faecium]PTX07562.1 hypothetical protein C8N37_11171 [Sphingobacterium faecium]GEM65889.1 hypothetical protein SF1_38710 [Sphingobacterium faecium NBRC 15299]